MNFPSLFLKESSFTRYFLSLVIWEIASWAVPVAVPILVAQKYGIGTQLAVSVGMQWLPSIFLGPFIGALINRFGPKKNTMCVMFGFCMVLLLFPLAKSIWQIQLIVLLMGLLSGIGTPTVLTLRAMVIPEGREVDCNALIQGVDRLAKVVAPLLVTVFMLRVGLSGEFLIAAIACFISALFIRTIPEMPSGNQSELHFNKIGAVILAAGKSLKGFYLSVRDQKIVMGVYRIMKMQNVAA